MNALSRIGNQAISLISLAVLARLLTPADFGLIAMVSAVIGIAAVLQDLGISAATIRARTLNHHQSSNLFWINVLAGLLMTGLAALAAPYIADFYGDPRIASLTLLMSAGFILSGLSAQHSALLKRNMHFSTIAKVTLASAIVTALASILGATLALNHIALALGSLAGSFATLLLNWYFCSWRPSAPKRHTNVRPLLHFGGHMTVFGIFGFLANNVHNLIIGRTFGAADAGVFGRAININNLLVGNLRQPLMLVAPPALARLRDDAQQFSSYYYTTCTLAVILAIPIAYIGGILSQETVALILGSQWEKVAPILQALSIAVVPTMVSISTGWVFQSAGNSKLMMYWGIFGWSCTIAATAWGAQFGLQQTAAAISTTAWILVIPNVMVAFSGTPLRLTALIQRLTFSIVSGSIAAIVGYWITHNALQDQSITSRFLFSATSFMLTYLLCLSAKKENRMLVTRITHDLFLKKMAGSSARK